MYGNHLSTDAVKAGRFDWFHPALKNQGGFMVCRRQTSRPYWTGHVYDWATGRTHAVHLGRDEKLTPEHLCERAYALAFTISNWMPRIPRRVRCPRCRR